MEAGRELDALVAEKVMGWHKEQWSKCRDRWSSGIPVDMWSPSTDIADAWQVVEKLSDRYWLKIHGPFMPKQPYFAGFTQIGSTGWNGRSDFEASSDTAPLAICLAALKATAGQAG